MSGQSLAKMVRNWEQMVSAFDRHRDEIPQFQPEFEALRVRIAGVKSFDDEKQRLLALRADALSERGKHAEAGKLVFGRLQASLQGHFGKRSETLLEFGLKPLPTPRKARAKEAAADAPPPSEATPAPQAAPDAA